MKNITFVDLVSEVVMASPVFTSGGNLNLDSESLTMLTIFSYLRKAGYLSPGDCNFLYRFMSIIYNSSTTKQEVCKKNKSLYVKIKSSYFAG